MNSLSVLVCALAFLGACTENSPEQKSEPEPVLSQITVSRLAETDGKTYVEVDGQPFPYMGAQIRLDALVNCEHRSLDEIEEYFAKAAELGVNCVQVPVWWRLVEEKKDIYDFTMVDAVLSLCNKYGLKMELLWFSTNMCGESFSYLTPIYVLAEKSRRLTRNDEGNFWDYYGYLYTLVLDDAFVIERETQAVTRLFNHIRYWDSLNGERHPVISAQIHNEPDILARWRCDEKGHTRRDGKPFTKSDAWQMALNAVDAVGQAVQNSSYKVLTRVNLVRSNGMWDFWEVPGAKPKDAFDRKGIDFISVDIYQDKVPEVCSEVEAYASLPGNYALVGENKGSYETSPSLILAAFSVGGGYNIYDIATPQWFLDHTSNREEVDHGVYTYDLKPKSLTEPTRLVVRGITEAATDVALTAPKDFAAFNISETVPKQSIEETLSTSSLSVSFSTADGSLGFALDRGGYAILYSTGKAVFTVQKQGMEPRTVNAEGGKTYRIDF